MESSNDDIKKEDMLDEELVASFFEEHKMEFNDDGFTQRVMHRLPERGNRVARIWSVVCAVCGIVLFIVAKPWHSFGSTIFSWWVDMNTSDVWYQSSPVMVYLSLLLLMAVGGYQLAMSER